MTPKNYRERVFTRTVSTTVTDEVWQELQKHKPWSKFIREAIQHMLDRPQPRFCNCNAPVVTCGNCGAEVCADDGGVVK